MIILLRPIISEKSMKLASSGEYTFEVARAANKKQIAEAVQEKFKVSVVGIKTINLKSKTKIQKRIRRFYQTGKLKKAIVKVKKGQIIPIFETPKDEAVVTTAEGEPIKIKERKDILGRTKVKVEKTSVGAAQTTQRKVITGK
ncbi:MAG: 50S ribosomal protein L23 [Candidatus Daviesbacteria bacterium]|nr:50S ribosomal protein L23 [Candidatus Daviesbacteria bacterium]